MMRLRFVSILLAAAVVAFAACFAFAKSSAKLSFAMPKTFPKSSLVELKDIKAEWSAADAATLTVKLTVAASARVYDPEGMEKVDVKSLSAEITADKGKTWKTAIFDKDAQSEGIWTAEVEFPEYAEKVDAAATGTPATAATATPTATGTLPATGTQTTETAAAHVTMEKKSSSGSGPVMKLGGQSISVDTRGLEKGAPKKTVETVAAAATAGGSEARGETKAESKYPDVTMAVCFTALDSLGNTTVELYSQADPQKESDVHFAQALSDPKESASRGETIPARDITAVSAAWLRGDIYVRADTAARYDKNDYVKNRDLQYLVARFVSADTISMAEQIGEGMYSYLMLEKVQIWPKKELYEGDPVMFTVDQRFIANLSALMSKDEKDLTSEQKELKKKILAGKVNLSDGYFLREKVQNTGLLTQVVGNHAYWKMNKSALTDAKDTAGYFKLTVFSGWQHVGVGDSFNTDDMTPYATIVLRHHVLKPGVGELAEDFSETKPAPVKMPPGLPPGAIWGN